VHIATMQDYFSVRLTALNSLS